MVFFGKSFFSKGNSSIGDKVFLDANGNGLQDYHERGVKGITVNLQGAGQDGQFGTSDDINLTQVTNYYGNYKFSGLLGGDYKVTFTDIPDGFDFTIPDVGSNGSPTRDSDVTDFATGSTDVFTLGSSKSITGIDAGLIAKNASVGDRVFLDANANGLQDAGEVGVSGITVNLQGAGRDGQFGTGDDVNLTQVTDANGNYTFSGLAGGQYRATFTDVPDGFDFTTPDAGDFRVDSDVTNAATGSTDVFTLGNSQNIDSLDAGLIQVNRDPSAVDDSRTTAFDTPTTINVLGNDADPDGDPLTVTSVAGQSVTPGDTVTVNNGTVTVLNNGQLSFTPDAGFTGDAGFSYHVSDGNGGEDTADVTVTVAAPLNGAPVATDDTQDTPFNTPTTIDVIGNDADPDGDPLTVTSIDGAPVAPGDTVTVDDGTVTVLNNGQLSFTPDDGFTGDAVFSYHVSDGNGGEDTADVTVTVAAPLNGAPVATDDTQDTPFNTPTTIDVIGNDADPDGDPLTVTSIDGAPVAPGDTVTVDDGTVTVLDNGQLSFTPDDGFTGDAVFSYHVSDGNGGEDTADVTVTVADPLNGAPVATDDTQDTPFNTPTTIDVIGNDADPDGDPLTVTSIDGAPVAPGDTVTVDDGTVTVLNNGQLSFTPDDGFTGDAVFSYHVSDGNGGEDTADVTVTVADPVTPVDPKKSVIGDQIFEDANSNGRRDSGEVGIAGVGVSLSGAGADGVFDTADDIFLSTTSDQAGIYKFRNLAAGDYKVTFDQPSGFEFTEANAVIDSRDSDANEVTGMTDVISLGINERNLTVDAGYVSTGGANTAPDANDDTRSTAFETPVNINVLENDTDPENDPLTVTSLNGASISAGNTVDVGNGSVTLLGNGQLSFTPDAGFSGTETFSYHVSDGNGGEDTANVTVTVGSPGGKNEIIGTNNDETLNGTDGDDSIQGLDGRDKIYGNNGNDHLFGDGGNDRVIGGLGDDTISGSNETLFGRFEVDVLLGGQGADKFILGNSEHAFYDADRAGDRAIVRDFNAGEGDTVQLFGDASIYRVKIGSTGTNLFCIQDPANDKADELIATFKDVQGLDLNSSSFEFV